MSLYTDPDPHFCWDIVNVLSANMRRKHSIDLMINPNVLLFFISCLHRLISITLHRIIFIRVYIMTFNETYLLSLKHIGLYFNLNVCFNST